MDGIAVQLTVLLSLLVGNVLFGLLPRFCAKWMECCSSSEHDCNRKVKCISFLLYFGGGIFMSNSFLVLLPQARREFYNQDDHSHEDSVTSQSNSSSEPFGHHHDNFPIPEFIVLCSFFMAYVLQELILFILSKCDNSFREISDLRVSFCSCAKRHTECSRTYKDVRPDQTLFGMGKQLMESGNPASSGAAMGSGLPDVTVTPKSDLLRSSIISQVVPNYGTVTNITETATDTPLPILAPPVLLAAERAMEHLTAARDHNKLLVSSTLIVIALTLQYIFLGIALELQTSPPINWQHLVIVFLQNFILTFSAGSDLATSSMELTYIVIHITLLSIMCPIGMIVTMFKTNSTEVSHIAKATVAAVVCGVLLYTAFYEMLKKKTHRCVVGLTKFIAVILGASMMAALQFAIVTL